MAKDFYIGRFRLDLQERISSNTKKLQIMKIYKNVDSELEKMYYGPCKLQKYMTKNEFTESLNSYFVTQQNI